MGATWSTWRDVTGRLSPADSARVFETCERLLRAAVTLASPEELWKSQFAEIVGELGGTAGAIVTIAPQFKVCCQHGRIRIEDIDRNLVREVLDRESAVLTGQSGAGETAILPIPSNKMGGCAWIITARQLQDEVLAEGWMLARALGLANDISSQTADTDDRVAKLRAILAISAAEDTETLLRVVAETATRLTVCDRASIFLWDRPQREVVACPALGVEGGMLRLPDNIGIVGEVLHSGKPISVNDAYADPRFSQRVDKSSGYRTKSLLCTPMRDNSGQVIGAFEVINKKDGDFTAADEITAADLADQVAIALRNTQERETLIHTHRQLTEQVTRGVSIIGESPAMVAMRGTVSRLAATDLPVLILGESGSGKEVVAQALHYQGPRSDRPFIAVNCAALTETLLESELFGHEKGAFTDAREMRRGKFELAEGGTIFLDEIGDMSQGGQAKLLRVLEQKVITRVGGSQNLPIHARVVAATNAKLAEFVRQKKFREDLYYRLTVVTIELPPLRARPEDVVPLADFFLRQFAVQARRPHLHLTADAKRRLQAHSWPGNVRELKNLMERVAFLAPAEKIESGDLSFILTPERDAIPEPSADFGLSEATIRFQQEFIRKAVARVRGNMSEAARLLGLHRSNLYRKMRQLEMNEAPADDDDSAGDV